MDRLSQALSDRYRIERQIGQGGMATVYLAHDLKHDRLPMTAFAALMLILAVWGWFRAPARERAGDHVKGAP